MTAPYPSSDIQTLNQLPPGTTAYIVGLDAAHPLRRRLLELGFVRGAAVRVLRRAPMGDPVHLRLGSSELALRQEDLLGIRVQL